MAYNKPLPAAMPMKAKALPPSPPMAKAVPIKPKPLPTRPPPATAQTIYSTSNIENPSPSGQTYTYKQTQPSSPTQEYTLTTSTTQPKRSWKPSSSRSTCCQCPDLNCCSSDFDNKYVPHSFSHLDDQAKSFLYWLLNDKLDMYCMMAFYVRTLQCKQLPMAIWKVFCVGAIQTLGLYLLYRDSAQSYPGCASAGLNIFSGSNAGLRWLSFLFTLYITMDNSTKIRHFNKWTMYMFGKDQPLFVNKLWIAIGFLVNIFVLFLSWFVAAFLIASSPDPIEVTLNALAIAFINELDVEIITNTDYETAMKWFGLEYGNFNASIVGRCQDSVGGFILGLLGLWEKPCACQCTGRLSFCGYCEKTILEWILLPFQILVPLIVFFCK